MPPDDLNRDHGGTVNEDRWSGYDPYTVRCEGFTGRGTLGSDLWRVTGEFMPAPGPRFDWRAEVTTSVSGIIPIDAGLGNGIEIYEPYPVSKFSRHGFVSQ